MACLVRAAGEGMRCAMVEAAQLYDVGGWGEEEEEGDGGLDHSPRPRSVCTTYARTSTIKQAHAHVYTTCTHACMHTLMHMLNN